MSKNSIENTNRIILIAGGSSSGKSSASSYLQEIREPIQFHHLDYDQQLQKISKGVTTNPEVAINMLINKLPLVASEESFLMDHWMPERLETLAREALSEYPVFYVWLHCSSEHELKRREKERKKKGDPRAKGMAIDGFKRKPTLKYDYILDTNKKDPEKVASLIYQNALKHWGLQ